MQGFEVETLDVASQSLLISENNFAEMHARLFLLFVGHKVMAEDNA